MLTTPTCKPGLWLAITAVFVACGGKENRATDHPPKATAKRDAGAAARRCRVAPSLRWPLRGRQGRDWVINNYVDVDPGTGSVRDYTGASGGVAKTYDGHTGVDIDIPSFRQMDLGAPVLAAADGTVVEVSDDQPDRNTRCTGTWNFVRVRHASGYVLTYGHLEKGSAAVKVGARVRAGAIIASVGSSGCSTQPHLHITVKDCNGAVVSPFGRELWKVPHDYAPELSVMDVMIRAGGHEGAATLKQPAPNPTRVSTGELVGFGVTAAGGSAGDTVGIKAVEPDGSVLFERRHQFVKARRHTYWYWNYRVPNEPLVLSVQATVNGYVATRRRLIVGALRGPARPGGRVTPGRP